MDLTLTATGLTETSSLLEGLVARGSDLQPVLEVLAEDFLLIEREQFASEGARGGAVWAPLLPATVRARGSAHLILRETNTLEASLTQAGASGAVRELTALSMTVGTDVSYAGPLQAGTRRMVARPPINLVPADEVRWSEAVAKYVAP